MEVREQFKGDSSSIVWVLGIKFRSSFLVTNVFTH